MKKKTNSVRPCAALLLAFLLCVQLVAPAFAADPDTIYIRSAEDLSLLATRCSLDTWSRGKTVILTTDLSLSDTDFAPIPTFGGTFNGADHTISGLSIAGKLSSSGLFSALQSTAVVQNLTVSGIVEPSGTNDFVGGIAGENSGLIENCTFNGIIVGSNSVGGIVGLNTLSGRLERCSVGGSITGKSMTGGLVGQNLGTVSGGTNRAYVNISGADPQIGLTELNLGLSSDLLTLRALDTVNIATDTGGIAGYSSGMLLNCQNLATVGYPHVGYNVGGIVGRNCGHIYRCTNQASVYGRKDVGGIAGQAEPYIILNLSSDVLSDLRAQLDELHTLVDGAENDALSTTDDLSDRLSAIGTTLDSAMDHTENLTDLLSDYGDSTITEINRAGDLLKDTVDALADLSDEADALSAHLSDGFSALSDAMNELEQAGELGTDAVSELRAAVTKLKKANDKLESGIEKINSGLNKLSTALRVENQEEVDAALASIESGFSDLLTASEELSAAFEHLTQALQEEGFGSEEVASAAKELADAQTKVNAALTTLLQGVQVLRKNITFDLSRFKSGLENIQDGLDEFDTALTRFDQAADRLQAALKHTESASEHLTDGFGYLETAMDRFGDASEDLSQLFDKIEDLLDHLAEADAIQLTHPSQEVDDSVDALFDTMEQLSGQLSSLNSTSNSSTTLLIEDLRAIGNQFRDAMNTMLDAVEKAENTGSDDLVSDISDENIDAVTSGKLLSCVNEGEICGDINVGGIVGSMSVEFELDPEDDLLSNDAALYRREYEMKAILQKCVNTGIVSARRNYSGAICGRMDLGLIVACEGYGSAESEQADYTGGIVGYAAGTVRDCFAKCRLSGRNYVGGIVGAAEDSAKISRCYSFVRLEDFEQYAGAVSGSKDGTFRQNYFVSDTLAGLDRVSIHGAAEPIEYAELLEASTLPDAFRSLTLRFLVDGQVVKEQAVSYGDDLPAEAFPALPAQEGCFGTWDTSDASLPLRFDADITALYTPYYTARPSSLRRADGRPIFLAEGQFEADDPFLSELCDAALADAPAANSLTAARRTVVEVWHLEGMNDSGETRALRYLPPEGTDHIELYAKQNGVWTKLDTSANGSYLLVEISGGEAELAVVACTSFWWVWLVAAAVVVLCGVLLHRKRRKRKAATASK